MGKFQKGKKKLVSTVMAVVFGLGVFCMGGCSELGIGRSKEPYVVTVDDLEIKVSETKIQELADLGYEVTDFLPSQMVQNGANIDFVYGEGYDMSIETEPNTIYYSNSLVKDGERIVAISVSNETQKIIPLGECIVDSVTLYPDEASAQRAVVEGIPFSDISVDSLTTVLGEPSYISDSKEVYKWERGDYALELNYREDGTLENLHIAYY